MCVATSSRGPGSSGTPQVNATTTQPRYGPRRLDQPGLPQQRIVGPLVQVDDHSLRRDLDPPRCVDELPKQPRWTCPAKALQPCGQAAIQQVGQYRQGQVEIHVQA